MMKLPVLILLLTTATAFAVPQRRHYKRQSERGSEERSSRCATRCTGVKNKFNYQVGQSYTYNFDSSSIVQLVGSEKPETTVRQTATVTISVIQPCEFSLKLSNVQIRGQELQSDSWRRELERRPLRFSFDDGIIGEICPDPQEPTWVLNIKRAILSTFQNALEGSTRNREVYETDVSGKCPAKYQITKDRRSEKTIVKNKDLIKCLNHRGNYTGIKGVQYNIKSIRPLTSSCSLSLQKLQNAPLVDSNQRCTHVINRRILKQATCTEKHSLQPFRNQKNGQDSGILAEVTQKLEYVSSRKENVQTPVGLPKQSLNFDHSEYEFEESAQSKSQVLSNLRQLCQISSDDVRPETPGLFTELVYGLRKLEYPDLQQIYQDVQKNRICSQDKKFFLDAIPACGTESCVQLMVTVLKTGTLCSKETLRWVTSLAFVPKPTVNMVKYVSELVNTIDSNGLLGISSLVHGYCRQNPGCSQVTEVSQIMTKLTNKLGHKCSSVRNQQSTGILILKAIGNIGHVQSAVPVLLSCLNEDRNPIQLRLAAIQALRRMPCGQQLEHLMSLFRDTSGNIEIRLVSFMTLMKCPTADLIGEIKDVLENEPITQVGSFVWSYLKEKSSTSDPCQRDLYDLLRHHRLSSKFNRDPRKFSRFYEFGKFMEQMNLGAHGESGLIMEPHGYLPRQGFFNFTMHLFGSSINLFEIGGRSEGLERLKDKLFGADGYFTNPTGYYFGETDRKDHSSPRVKTLQDLFTSNTREFSEQFSMSMYLKVFGDDLMYYDFQNDNMIDEIKNLANTEKLMQSLAQQRNFKISKNILFLDSVMTIPTISGIPLRLAVNGTASVNVEYGGKMDFTQIIQPPHNRIEILGQIKPSAAIELSSTMALHVRDMKTGVKMVGRLHTSTAANGAITLRDGEFKAKLELPDDQMEIFDVQYDLFHIVANRRVAEPTTRDNLQSQSCTPTNINHVTGLKICSSVTSRGASRTSYGSVRAKLTVEKQDPSLRSYELTAKVLLNNPNDQLFEFGIDTPGSRVNREIKAKIQYKPGEMLKADLKTPKKEYNLLGELTMNQNIDQGELSLTVDNKDRYAVTAKIEKTVQRGRQIRSWEFQMTGPNQGNIKLTGNLHLQSKRYSADFRLEGLLRELGGRETSPIEGSAKWEQPETENQKFNSELMFKCPGLINFDLNAFGEAGPSGSLQYQYSMEYKRPGDRTPHKITASQKQVIQRDPPKNYVTLLFKFCERLKASNLSIH